MLLRDSRVTVPHVRLTYTIELVASWTIDVPITPAHADNAVILEIVEEYDASGAFRIASATDFLTLFLTSARDNPSKIVDPLVN